jgi:hypothetical protein
MDDLKLNIKDTFDEIDNDTALCNRVCISVPLRLQDCINVDGGQFEHSR